MKVTGAVYGILATLLRCLATNGEMVNGDFLRIIPIQVHGQNSGEVMELPLHINIFNDELDSTISTFCEDHAIQDEFCSLLYNHVATYIVQERKILEDAGNRLSQQALALPNAHLARHEDAVLAEYTRVFHPEMFEDFSDIIIRENDIVDALKHAWSKQYTVQRVCFIHSCQLGIGGDTRILEDLLHQISKFGLEDTLDSIVILNYGFPIDPSVMGRHSHKVEWVQVHDEIHYFEVPTLRILHRLAGYLHSSYQPNTGQDSGGSSNNGGSGQVLYLHTKGVSYQEVHPQVEDWRNMMMYFLVERHASCIHLLQSGEVDCVGTNYMSLPRHMFSGNFWWASASYLASRPEQRYQESAKYEAESWLLQESTARIFTLHNSNIVHSRHAYPRHCYALDHQTFSKSSSTEGECGGPRTKRESRKYWQLMK